MGRMPAKNLEEEGGASETRAGGGADLWEASKSERFPRDFTEFVGSHSPLPAEGRAERQDRRK